MPQIIFEISFNDWTDETSEGRNDIVFEGKNQHYGAFEIRRNYNKTLAISLSVAVVLFLILFLIGKLFFKSENVIIPEYVITEVDLSPPPMEEMMPASGGGSAEGSGPKEEDIASESQLTENIKPVVVNKSTTNTNESTKPIVKEKIEPIKEEKPKVDLAAEAAEKKRKEEEALKKELDKKFKNFSSANGNGGQGSGNSNEGGNGKGKGDGNRAGNDLGNGGGGIPGGGSYKLKGRNLLKMPTLKDDSQDEGKVVVEIIVDRKGNVIKATPGVKGTTANSSTLFKKAQQAAYEAKFSANPDAQEEQIGLIEFIFKIRN